MQQSSTIEMNEETILTGIALKRLRYMKGTLTE
jgi:hypothetical protein